MRSYFAGASVRAAILASILVLCWQALVVAYLWDGVWNGLFCTGSRTEVPAEAAAGLYRVPDSNGYDAQYYRLIARDPFFAHGYQRYMDDAALRYRRILIPFASYAVALGRAQYIDAVYIVWILVSVFAGVLWTGQWFEQRGRSGYYGFLFLLVPAVLTSIDRMLLDGPLCTMFAGFAWKMSKGERPWSILICAPLVKETGVFFAAALCLTDLRSRRWKSALTVAATQIPALCWFAFVYAEVPRSKAEALFARPAGQIERLITPRSYPGPKSVEVILQAVDVVAVLSLLGSLVIAIVWFWPYATAVELAVVLFAMLGIGMGTPSHMVEAYGFSRPVSPLLWALMVHGVAQRKWVIAAVPLGLTLATALPLLSETIRALRAV
jgi:hypothetical protein